MVTYYIGYRGRSRSVLPGPRSHHGVGADHLDAYLDEFVFRSNRRHNRAAGFASLLGLTTEVPPTTASVISPFSATAKRRGRSTGQTGLIHRNPPPPREGEAPRRERAAAASQSSRAPVGCSLLRQPPTSTDEQFSVVVYNRTQAPVFVLRHEVAACGSTRMPARDMLVGEATPPPGVAIFLGATKITAPRGYTGTVSVVITAGGSSAVTVGDIPDSTLPPCLGTA
jgi:hypothetical protein